MVTVSAEGDLERLAARLRDGIEGATEASVVDGTILLGVKGAKGVLPQVVRVAEEANQTVSDLSISEPTLETVFIKLTGKDLRE
jgi:ABC-2 type transport system ATP-binding protein